MFVPLDYNKEKGCRENPAAKKKQNFITIITIRKESYDMQGM